MTVLARLLGGRTRSLTWRLGFAYTVIAAVLLAVVLALTNAIVERARRIADAAEVEAHGRIAQGEEGLGQRLCHLVIERPALQRVRVRHQRNAGQWNVRHVADHLDQSDGSVDCRSFGCPRRQIFSRSTISPPTTWRSMISSMSSLST